MSVRKLALLALLATAAQPALAHDFWISLDRWQVPGDDQLQADLRVGTGAEPEPWQMRPERVVSFRTIAPDRTIEDRTDLLAPPDTLEWHDAVVPFSGTGTHMLVFETTPALSDLEAVAFDEYVAHEGLSAVAAHRAALKTRGSPGRELYARRAKALVQVGTDCSPHALQPLGLSLEIVPLVNPHCTQQDTLPVEVRFRGRPLAGGLVRMESLSSPAGEIEQRTDANGRASFAMPKTGNWKISLVWSVPIENNPQADYDTLFSSLSFGFAGTKR
jgi:uncharacterized GH25 family protein